MNQPPPALRERQPDRLLTALRRPTREIGCGTAEAGPLTPRVLGQSSHEPTRS